VLGRVLQAVPQAAGSRAWLAEAQARQGQADAAVATLREGLRLTPDAPVLHRALGSVLERADQPREAADAYRKYVSLAPNAPDAAAIVARAQNLEAQAR